MDGLLGRSNNSTMGSYCFTMKRALRTTLVADRLSLWFLTNTTNKAVNRSTHARGN